MVSAVSSGIGTSSWPLTPMMTTTADVAGVWARQWEEDPLGDEAGADRTTLVHWTQSSASGIYVDLRLPIDSPGRSQSAAAAAGIVPRPGAIAANGYSKAAQEQLAGCFDPLLRQKSFAGVLNYQLGDTTSGDALSQDKILAQLASSQDPTALSLCTCFWRRDLDYQPPSGGLDVGVCASEPERADGSILLRETGDDASYAEGWLRMPSTNKGPFMALELLSENGVPARKGYWVRTGRRFAYAVGRPMDVEAARTLQCVDKSHEVAAKVGKDLATSVKELADSEDDIFGLLGSYVACSGEISDNGQWDILHSTHPELVGCRLVGGKGQELCCSYLQGGNDHVDQVLAGDNAITRTWKVFELEECVLPL